MVVGHFGEDGGCNLGQGNLIILFGETDFPELPVDEVGIDDGKRDRHQENDEGDLENDRLSQEKKGPDHRIPNPSFLAIRALTDR
jgi:hypothetical protein